jgi:DNA-binding NarL/FixJ family response regulator
MPASRRDLDFFGFRKKGTDLTEREIELLCLIADGLMGKEIAVRMRITLKGVEFNKTKLYEKIGVTNAVGATRFAIRNGYVQA